MPGFFSAVHHTDVHVPALQVQSSLRSIRLGKLAENETSERAETDWFKEEEEKRPGRAASVLIILKRPSWWLCHPENSNLTWKTIFSGHYFMWSPCIWVLMLFFVFLHSRDFLHNIVGVSNRYTNNWLSFKDLLIDWFFFTFNWTVIKHSFLFEKLLFFKAFCEKIIRIK